MIISTPGQLIAEIESHYELSYDIESAELKLIHEFLRQVHVSYFIELLGNIFEDVNKSYKRLPEISEFKTAFSRCSLTEEGKKDVNREYNEALERKLAEVKKECDDYYDSLHPAIQKKIDGEIKEFMNKKIKIDPSDKRSGFKKWDELEPIK